MQRKRRGLRYCNSLHRLESTRSRFLLREKYILDIKFAPTSKNRSEKYDTFFQERRGVTLQSIVYITTRFEASKSLETWNKLKGGGEDRCWYTLESNLEDRRIAVGDDVYKRARR